jgi:hypothetical protein
MPNIIPNNSSKERLIFYYANFVALINNSAIIIANAVAYPNEVSNIPSVSKKFGRIDLGG